MARTKNPNTEETFTRSFRLPVSLIYKLEQEAVNSDRSLNRVVVRMLENQLNLKNPELQKK